MDDDEIWDIEMGEKDEDAVSFFYTLLHELGHSFGLGHSSTTESIMFPWYSSSRTFDRSRKDLFDDDIIAVEQLYGLKDGRRRFGPNTIPKTTRRITTAITTPKPREPVTRPTPPSTTRAPKPDKCKTSYDAIGVLRSELMIFKDIWMWRLRDGEILDGYPVEFKRMWPELEPFNHIDAVFERSDGKFVFFHGQDVVVIDSYRKVYTHNLEYLGFARHVRKIDAIFRWGYNNKTYIFSGDDYWK
jgi:Matrixin/Hemopexin